MEKKIKSFPEITSEDIQDWKARHGANALSQATVKGEDDQEANFIIVTPSRSVIDVVAQHGLSKNVVAANKALVSNCVLGGDMEVLEKDGAVYSELLIAIRNLLKKKEVTVKKL